MELRQMRYFLAVAEELHFGRAAARLHIAEQPLGYQIRKLEAELGVRLLDRTTRSVSLTPAGASFMADARRILEQSERAADAARRIGAGEMGVVRLGYEASVVPSVMPEFVRKFRAERPDIGLILVEHSTVGLTALKEGETDACLVTRYERLPQWVDYIPFAEDRVVIALPLGHPLSERDCVRLADLRGERLLGYSGAGNEGVNLFLAQLLDGQEWGASVTQMAEGYMALLGLVAAGLGFTIVTERIGRAFADRVALLPLVDPLVRVDCGLALRKDDQPPTSEALRVTAKQLSRTL